MQLLIYIMKKTELLPRVLAGFMKEGISGTTVIDSQGALQLINQSSVDAPPIFGSLRQFLNPKGAEEKMLLVVLPEDKVAKATQIIKNTVDITKPDTGIFFTVQVGNVEGLAK